MNAFLSTLSDLTFGLSDHVVRLASRVADTAKELRLERLACDARRAGMLAYSPPAGLVPIEPERPKAPETVLIHPQKTLIVETVPAPLEEPYPLDEADYGEIEPLDACDAPTRVFHFDEPLDAYDSGRTVILARNAPSAWEVIVSGEGQVFEGDEGAARDAYALWSARPGRTVILRRDGHLVAWLDVPRPRKRRVSQPV